MEGKLLARIGALVFVAAALTATAVEMTRKDERPERSAAHRAATSSSDPLRDQLVRCTRMGEAAMRDKACLDAWAENRARFLGHRTRPASETGSAFLSPSAADATARAFHDPDKATPPIVQPRPGGTR